MSAALLDDDEDDLPQARHDHVSRDNLPGGGGQSQADQYEAIDADDQFQPLTGQHAEPDDTIRGDDEGAEDAGQREPRSRIARRRALQRRRAEEQQRIVETQQAEIERLRAEAEENRAFRERVSPRLDQLDHGRYQEQVASVDREIQSTAQRVERAIEAMSEAITTGDAAAHAKALRDHSQALSRGFELNAQKQLLEATRGQQPLPPQQFQQPQPQQQQVRQQPVVRQVQPDPEVARLTNDFLSRHRWFRPNDPRDLDTQTAKWIDQQVAEEGFDPADPEYWEEVEARCKQRMPHLFQKQQPRQPAAQPQQPQAQRRGPMVSGSGAAGGGNSNGNGTRRVLMTPDRKQALIQIGALDPDGRTIVNNEKYQRVMQRFHEFDTQNGVGSQR